jgi:SAM-dependent methyltransferase
MSNELTSKEFWSSAYRNERLRYSEEGVVFKDLFEKYLPEGGSCFEVGCYPGTFLIYLGKRFNYTVSGIDWMPNSKEMLQERLHRYGVKVGHLVEGDFLAYHTESKYDVVCSFGFMEHFIDIERVITLHLELLKPGGILVISCPNFKKAQYLLHRWLDRDGLDHHNLEAMDFGRWHKTLTDNNMEILYQNYYQTIGFWATRSHVKSVPSLARNWAISALGYSTLAISKLTNFPNSVLSPHMISISKKKEFNTLSPIQRRDI